MMQDAQHHILTLHRTGRIVFLKSVIVGSVRLSTLYHGHSREPTD